MVSCYSQTLTNMEQTLFALERRVPAPQLITNATGTVYRYVEKTIHQAIIQKLARMVSGLNAACALLVNGFVQEQGAIHRMLGEFQEDITFLSCAIIAGDVTELHRRYLDAFYEEEFDKATPLESTQKRPMISRQKIRAYLANVEWAGTDPSRGVELTRTLSKVNSGFVHGASPHIMEMYGGNPPHFHVSGMLGTPRAADHADDLWNYFYRGILAFGTAAKAFGDQKLYDTIMKYAVQFERRAGKSYTPSID